MEEIRRMFAEELEKCFDRWRNHLDQKFECTEENKRKQSLAGLPHELQQRSVATEADAKTDTRTRKRTEGAAANGAKNGYITSARVDHDPMRLTSFDDYSIGLQLYL